MDERTVASLWFVTPAWRRFELSAVCFEQRRRVMDELVAQGIEARCVVVSDDENLDLARAVGFDTFERDNEWLGRRFNDGIEYAGQHGADWIVPIGSDSWVDASYFLPLPEVRTVRTSRMYSVVTDERIAMLRVGRRGAGPYMLPRSILEQSHFRPAKDLISRGVDHSTIEGLTAARWVFRDDDPLQYVGFRGEPHLTSYDKLWYYWGEREEQDPFGVLAEHYPADLVERARLAMTPALAVAS